MQTLVAVGLRNGNPVAHTVGIWCVEVADNRVYKPTLRLLLLLRTVDDNAQGKDIVYTLKWHLLLAHLVPNRVYRLGAALDVVVDARVVHSLAYWLEELLDKCHSLLLALGKLIDNVGISLRLELAEGKILKLTLYII